MSKNKYKLPSGGGGGRKRLAFQDHKTTDTLYSKKKKSRKFIIMALTRICFYLGHFQHKSK